MKSRKRVEFFFVGVGKCGTSWIYEFLLRNNIGSLPSIKEPYLIDLNDDEKEDLVEKMFTDFEKMCDFSTLYYWDMENARKISEYNSKAKVVITVRKPSDRIVSHFHYLRKFGLIKTEILSDYLLNDYENIVDRCRYRDILSRYQEYFPPDSILILPLEHLATDPQAYVDRLVGFLGEAKVEISDEDKTIVRKRATARNVYIAYLAKKFAGFLREHGFVSVLAYFKSSSLIGKTLFRETSLEKNGKPTNFGVKTETVKHLDSDYETFLEEYVSG